MPLTEEAIIQLKQLRESIGKTIQAAAKSSLEQLGSRNEDDLDMEVGGKLSTLGLRIREVVEQNTPQALEKFIKDLQAQRFSDPYMFQHFSNKEINLLAKVDNFLQANILQKQAANIVAAPETKNTHLTYASLLKKLRSQFVSPKSPAPEAPSVSSAKPVVMVQKAANFLQSLLSSTHKKAAKPKPDVEPMPRGPKPK